MRGKITKRKIDELQAGARDVFLWDTDLPGFGCKITPKGARIYVLQYGQAGRDHQITIGRHGIDVTAEQARLEAQRLRGLIATGETPTAIATKQTEVVTVAELGQRYLDEYAIPHKKPSGIAQDRRNLQNHVVPLMGKLRVTTVERADVARVMREVAAGKTAKDEKTKHQGRRIVRGGEIVANRVQALLSKMFTLAEDWKLRPEGSNPCSGVKRYAEHKVERFLSADELARLGAALASEAAMAVQRSLSGGTSGQRRLTGTRAASIAALRLLLLTGCRVGEVLSLRWAKRESRAALAVSFRQQDRCQACIFIYGDRQVYRLAAQRGRDRIRLSGLPTWEANRLSAKELGTSMQGGQNRWPPSARSSA